MAAGTWTTQNKVRPGVYVNFNNEAKPLGTVGERGVTTIPLMMSWGEPGRIISVEAGEDTSLKFGYTLAAPQMLMLREALKNAKTVLAYRVNTGTKASVTAGNLTATAKWGGTRGNDLIISIDKSVDGENLFNVSTLLSGISVDRQTVSKAEELISNDWVVFGGTGVLDETAGAPLTGGADGTAANQDYMDYLEAVEVFDFNTMAFPVTDNILKGLAAAFCKRMREEEGKNIQVVVENYPIADYEGVISVKNGVLLSDGATLTAAQAAAWVAGATAGSGLNESLTYRTYDGAVDAVPRYTNSQITAALQEGEFVFASKNNRVVVEQDINTLTGFEANKGRAFSKNRVIRVLDGINRDFVRIFSDFYLGKVSNNEDGRNLLKNECINYLEVLQGIEAIRNFDSQADVVIRQGNETDSVYIESYIQPVDSVEKIYMQVKIG